MSEACEFLFHVFYVSLSRWKRCKEVFEARRMDHESIKKETKSVQNLAVLSQGTRKKFNKRVKVSEDNLNKIEDLLHHFSVEKEEVKKFIIRFSSSDVEENDILKKDHPNESLTRMTFKEKYDFFMKFCRKMRDFKMCEICFKKLDYENEEEEIQICMNCCLVKFCSQHKHLMKDHFDRHICPESSPCERYFMLIRYFINMVEKDGSEGKVLEKLIHDEELRVSNSKKRVRRILSQRKSKVKKLHRKMNERIEEKERILGKNVEEEEDGSFLLTPTTAKRVIEYKRTSHLGDSKIHDELFFLMEERERVKKLNLRYERIKESGKRMIDSLSHVIEERRILTREMKKKIENNKRRRRSSNKTTKSTFLSLRNFGRGNNSHRRKSFGGVYSGKTEKWMKEEMKSKKVVDTFLHHKLSKKIMELMKRLKERNRKVERLEGDLVDIREDYNRQSVTHREEILDLNQKLQTVNIQLREAVESFEKERRLRFQEIRKWKRKCLFVIDQNDEKVLSYSTDQKEVVNVQTQTDIVFSLKNEERRKKKEKRKNEKKKEDEDEDEEEQAVNYQKSFEEHRKEYLRYVLDERKNEKVKKLKKDLERIKEDVIRFDVNIQFDFHKCINQTIPKKISSLFSCESLASRSLSIRGVQTEVSYLKQLHEERKRKRRKKLQLWELSEKACQCNIIHVSQARVTKKGRLRATLPPTLRSGGTQQQYSLDNSRIFEVRSFCPSSSNTTPTTQTTQNSVPPCSPPVYGAEDDGDRKNELMDRLLDDDSKLKKGKNIMMETKTLKELHKNLKMTEGIVMKIDHPTSLNRKKAPSSILHSPSSIESSAGGSNNNSGLIVLKNHPKKNRGINSTNNSKNNSGRGSLAIMSRRGSLTSKLNSGEDMRFLHHILKDHARLKKYRVVHNWRFYVSIIKIQQQSELFDLESEYVNFDMKKRSFAMIQLFEKLNRIVRVWRRRRKLISSLSKKIDDIFLLIVSRSRRFRDKKTHQLERSNSSGSRPSSSTSSLVYRGRGSRLLFNNSPTSSQNQRFQFNQKQSINMQNKKQRGGMGKKQGGPRMKQKSSKNKKMKGSKSGGVEKVNHQQQKKMYEGKIDQLSKQVSENEMKIQFLESELKKERDEIEKRDRKEYQRFSNFLSSFIPLSVLEEEDEDGEQEKKRRRNRNQRRRNVNNNNNSMFTCYPLFSNLADYRYSKLVQKEEEREEEEEEEEVETTTKDEKTGKEIKTTTIQKKRQKSKIISLNRMSNNIQKNLSYLIPLDTVQKQRVDAVAPFFVFGFDRMSLFDRRAVLSNLARYFCYDIPPPPPLVLSPTSPIRCHSCQQHQKSKKKKKKKKKKNKKKKNRNMSLNVSTSTTPSRSPARSPNKKNSRKLKEEKKTSTAPTTTKIRRRVSYYRPTNPNSPLNLRIRRRKLRQYTDRMNTQLLGKVLHSFRSYYSEEDHEEMKKEVNKYCRSLISGSDSNNVLKVSCKLPKPTEKQKKMFNLED